MKDYVVNKSIVPLLFGLSVSLTACSGTNDMAAPSTGAAQSGVPASGSSNNNQTPATPSLGTVDNGTDNSADNNTGADGNSAGTDGNSGTSTADNGSDNEPADNGAVDLQLVAGASQVACDTSDAEQFRETMLAVIRASRAAARMCGDSSHGATTTVTWNPLLAEAALSHVQDMATFNFFSHEGSDGLSVSNRADNVGYNWRAIGENIAAGQLDIEEVHQGWLDSPGHCRNIMNPIFTEVGAACVVGSDTDYGTYWAVVFGDQL
jgi:uncharacterized protein YkwD